MRNILVVPCCETGKGGGHLTRCINLVKDLRITGNKAFLYLHPETNISNFENLFNSTEFNREWLNYKNYSDPFDLIILDRYKIPLNEILFWKNLAPVIGIDEGGKHRDKFDFLIDMLIPENFIKPAANIASPGLLIKKLTTNHTNQHEHFKILISFGQEDSAGLGLKTTKILSNMKNNQNLDITLLRGNLSTPHSPLPTPNSIKIINSIPNLAEHLHEYDLVITHYGLTAYEALFAGTRVLLDHPTRYHKKIAKAAGFKTFSKKKFTTNHTNRHEQRKRNENSSSCGFEPAVQRLKISTLSELINTFSPIVNRHCPVCDAAAPNKSIARYNDRTYRRCTKCGIIFMDRINPAPIEYEKEYFFESYKKQYGKTYLEDFENIKQNGKSRLKRINAILSRRDAEAQREDKDSEIFTLLDIGCAYGPFLDVARDEGFLPFGIDPTEDAVKYVNEKLGIKAIHSLFPTPHSLLPIYSFDVITLWYVIEHFKDCTIVLAEIRKLLKDGGVLAFSTPSFSGISGRKNLRKFLSASPADHFTVWSPITCKKALSLVGFKVKKIVVAGHHPERFPLLGKFANNKKGVVYKLLMTVSKLFGLGDTFEVYAIKIFNHKPACL